MAILYFCFPETSISFATGQKKNSALMVLWVSSEGSVRALGGAPQEEAEAQTWGQSEEGGSEPHPQGSPPLPSTPHPPKPATWWEQ